MWRSVREILPQALARFSITEQQHNQELLSAWTRVCEEVMGTKYAQRSCALSIKNEKLTIAVSTNSDASMFQTRSRDILKTLRAQFPNKHVKQLVFIIQTESLPKRSRRFRIRQKHVA